ncbi:hypothetical protein [Streptomyces sp. NPDC051211]|uniref:hypothetical protein n=1 Tax=Streptomyces sp. NPDC051211 TaxID=3154643 RepID=UPI0034509D2A
MSTPENQHPQAQPPQAGRHRQTEPQPEPGQQGLPQDPYATQTWQTDTWDTTYQPVLGAVPGQSQPLAAPDSWFRDEPAPAPDPAAAPWAGGPTAPEQGAVAPDPAAAGSWQPAAEQAYLPSYEAPAQAAGPAYAQQPPQQPYPGSVAGQPAPGEAWAPEPVAPAGWFRDEPPSPSQAHAWPPDDAAPAQAPQWSGPAGDHAQGQAHGQDPAQAQANAQAQGPASAGQWSGRAEEQAQGQAQGQGHAQAPASAAETAYLPPYPGPGLEGHGSGSGFPGADRQAPADPAETAYLPPYRGDELAPQVPSQAQAPASAAETAYLPPYPGPAGLQAPADPAETAYLPPYPGPDSGDGSPYPTYEAPDPVAEPAPEAAPGPAEEYSSPTLAGTTRIRDPRQARAEGRSPIIDPGPQSALVTAALGALLAGAAAVADLALLVPLIALQALTAAGWFRLNGMWPARQGIALAFAGAVTADIAVLAVDEVHRPGAVIGTLGAWVLLTLVLQLRSHADPDERVYGLMASVASAALAVICAGYLAAAPAAVTAGAAAVAVAVFTRALPLPPAPSVVVSLAAAAGAGIAAGGLTPIGAGGALVGLAAGVCALIGLRVAAYDYPSKFVHMTAGVALPLAAAAPAIYLMGRVVN